MIGMLIILVDKISTKTLMHITMYAIGDSSVDFLGIIISDSQNDALRKIKRIIKDSINMTI